MLHLSSSSRVGSHLWRSAHGLRTGKRPWFSIPTPAVSESVSIDTKPSVQEASAACIDHVGAHRIHPHHGSGLNTPVSPEHPLELVVLCVDLKDGHPPLCLY